MFYRIDDTCNPLDFRTTEQLRDLAARAGVPVKSAVARCQHGYSRSSANYQTCNACENGYVDDGHTFAALRSPPLVAMVTDDGDSVLSITWHYISKVRKVEPDLTEAMKGAQRHNYGGNYWPDIGNH